jgi:hypothetical protein
MAPIRTPEDWVAKRGRLVLIGSLVLAAFTVSLCLKIAASPPDAVILAVTWALWAITNAGYVLGFTFRFGRTGRAVINDELARAHRDSAIRIGFATLIAGTLTECLAALGVWTSPAWWSIAALSAAWVTMGMSYAVLELRTDA